MIRFIFERRSVYSLGGPVVKTHHTILADCPQVEEYLTQGGIGLDACDVVTLVGAHLEESTTTDQKEE